MAKPTTTATVFIFFLLLAAANSDDNTTAAIQEELSAMLQILKFQGRTLFTNAIATSDLQYHLTTASPITYSTSDAAANPSSPPASTPSFTLFAPMDAPIFSLDMSLPAEAYVSTLKYHVIPSNRYTSSDLQNLTSQFLETLLPHHSVLIGRVQNGNVSELLVDGVRVSDPDLFVGSRFAVHGIDGILVTGINDNQDYGAGEGSNVFSPAEAPGPSTFLWYNLLIGSPAPAQGQMLAGRVGGGKKRNRRSRHRKGRVNKRRKRDPVHKSHDDL